MIRRACRRLRDECVEERGEGVAAKDAIVVSAKIVRARGPGRELSPYGGGNRNPPSCDERGF
jgi:hypothetical protein